MRILVALVGLLASASMAAALPPCSPQQLLAPDGVGFAWFGSSVALDGDTMLVGAYRDPELFGSGGAAYVRRWDGSAWAPEAKLQPPDGGASDEFGISVSLDGDTAVVGSWQADGPGGADQGAVYIFVRSPGGSTWTQQAKLLASDGAAGDTFGREVAIRGNEIFVGAPGDDGGAGADQGSAYVFTRSAGVWSERTKIVPSDAGAGDQFGRSVALGTGTALIGAPYDDSTAGADEGAAYVFVGTGASWTQEAKLTAADNTAGDWFGRTVSLDGDTAAICALFDDGPGASNDGSVTVFSRAGGVWTQQQKLFGENGDSSDWFGYSIALSGGTLLIGRPQGDFNDANHKGGAREYRWTGSTWAFASKLDPPGLAFGDYYGLAVAIDGDTVVCGAGGDFVAAENQGSVWVFRRSGGEWFEPDYGLITGDAASEALGTSVDLDGDTMAIGIPGYDGPGGNDQGAVRIYRRDGLLWTVQQTVLASDGALSDAFGTSVSLDGDTLAIGAPLDSVGGGSNQGSVYVFVRSGGVWTEQQKLLASDRATSDNFGQSVAVSGDRLIVGAPGANAGFTDAGAAYAFARSAGVWSQQDKLTPADAAASDAFGISVALDGMTAVVGAYLDNVSGTDDGSAYIFCGPSTGTDWLQCAKLVAADSATNAHLGRRVAIDGDAVLVGANQRSETFATNLGAAYVFRKQPSSSLWVQEAKLQPSDGASFFFFGRGVSLDGDFAAIGAGYDEFFSGTNTGSVYLFERRSGVWRERSTIVASGGALGDGFGFGVALDEGTLVVGAPGDDTGVGATFTDRGSAQTFCVREECLPVLVTNSADGSAHGTLAAALSAATPFDALEANASAFWATGSLGAPGMPLFIESSGGMRQPLGQTLTLGAGSMLASAAGDILDFYGSTVFGGVTLSTASEVRNFGTMSLSGTIDGDLVNERTLVAPASLTVYGDALNRGTITIESGTLTIVGALTDEGTIVGDLSGGRPAPDAEEEQSSSEANAAAGGVSASGGYAAGASASLSLPSAGSRFTCGGDFIAAINDHARFDLRSAELRMNGGGAPQKLEAMSIDIGATLNGLDRTQAGRFPIGTLRLAAGASVTVMDGSDNDGAGQGSCEAVYAETLVLDAGSVLSAPACRVYYKTLVNNGGTITTPTGVILIPPFCPGNANGDDVVDFDDITSALANWGADYGAGTGAGDANGDHLVDFDDITEVLANWGADCQ